MRVLWRVVYGVGALCGVLTALDMASATIDKVSLTSAQAVISIAAVLILSADMLRRAIGKSDD